MRPKKLRRKFGTGDDTATERGASSSTAPLFNRTVNRDKKKSDDIRRPRKRCLRPKSPEYDQLARAKTETEGQGDARPHAPVSDPRYRYLIILKRLDLYRSVDRKLSGHLVIGLLRSKRTAA